MRYSLSELQLLLRQAGWPDVTINTRDGPAPLIPLFASIALAESGGDPTAHNPSGEDSWGLLQVNRHAHPQYSAQQLQQPLPNLQIALGIYNSEGLRAWGAFTDGSYLGRGQYRQSLALYQQGASPQWPTPDDSDVTLPDDSSSFYYDESIVPQQTSGIGISAIAAVVLGVLALSLIID